MLATIPALEYAAHDARLTPTEKAALLWCYHTPLLTVAEFRPLKTVSLQLGARLACSAPHVLRRLAQLGYLEDAFENDCAPEELRRLTRPRWYKLVYRVHTVPIPRTRRSNGSTRIVDAGDRCQSFAC